MVEQLYIMDIFRWPCYFRWDFALSRRSSKTAQPRFKAKVDASSDDATVQAKAELDKLLKNTPIAEQERALNLVQVHPAQFTQWYQSQHSNPKASLSHFVSWYEQHNSSRQENSEPIHSPNNPASEGVTQAIDGRKNTKQNVLMTGIEGEEYTKIFFPNGNTVIYQGLSENLLRKLQYKVVSAPLAKQENEESIIYLTKNNPAFAHLLQDAQSQSLSEQEWNSRLEEAFKLDTDSDGVIDLLDKQPNIWNVSERDLRNFSVLAYENEIKLSKAFEGEGSPKALVSYVENRYKVGKVDEGNMDLGTLTKHWDLIEFGNPGSGLQYVIFGNGEKSEGKYQNIVVAFRGTESSSINDITADLKIYDGRVPTQASYLEDIARKIESLNPDNVYATGHSLGGYLAQYFAAETMQRKPEWQDNFTHSALFNPVPLPNENHTATARKLSDQFSVSPVTEVLNKTNSYVIKGEFVSDGAVLAGLGVVAAETAKKAGWGAFLGLLLAPLTGGASLAIGTAIGAGVGAATGITNGGKAAKGLGYYDNTTLFEFKQDDLWGKHNLSSFFERDGKLKIHFSNGYRFDTHYLSDDSDLDGLSDYHEARIGTKLTLSDSDNDGIDDTIEVRVGANPLAEAETPWANVTPEGHFDDTPLIMFAEMHQANGTQLKSLVLTPTQTEDGVMYRVTDVMDVNEVLNLALLLEQTQLNANTFTTLFGDVTDDTFLLGASNVIVNGGEGRDRFVFNQVKANAVSYLNDFDPAYDKLVLNSDVFQASQHLKYDQAKGQLFYKDVQIVSLEQGLQLDRHHIELI